jgi:uncharacterized protein (DUF983 family)
MTTTPVCTECKHFPANPNCPYGSLCERCGHYAGQDALARKDDIFRTVMTIVTVGPIAITALVVLGMLIALSCGF